MGKLPTPEDFATVAERMMEEMRAQGVVGNIAYDRENQRLLNESIAPLSVGDLAFPYVKAPKEVRPELVQRHIAAHLRGRQAIETWDEARERILPELRPEFEIALWPLRNKLEGMVIPSMPTGRVTEHLRTRFVWEVKDARVAVETEDVERWGVTLDEIQDAAAENLLKRTPRPAEWATSPQSPGVLQSKWRDGFDATRVILTHPFQVASHGPLVAVATSDRNLFVADSGDEAALFQLGLAARRETERTNQMLWLWPLLLDGEERRHWLPDETSGAHASLSMCAAVHAQTVYHLHGTFLQRVLEAEGVPTRVGEVGIMQTPLGSAGTVGVWRDGAPAAVAHTDVIQFRRGEEVLGVAPFAQVAALPGDLLEEMPGYPKRFRAMTFPEPWQLSQLGIDTPP